MRKPLKLWTVSLAVVILLSAPIAGAAIQEIPDGDITNAVETEMFLHEEVASHLIDVETSDGIVTLSGTSDNLLAKNRAEEIAESTAGVRSVMNLIEVMPAERSDSKIEDDVVSALARDPAADSYELNVSVNDGMVTLTGTVESWQEKRLAGEVASGVLGVRSVENEIDIEYTADRLDSEIRKEIERRLETDVRVDDKLIDVEVDNGTVELSGTVGSLAEKARARTDAWVTGVEMVDAADLDIEWWARDEMKRSRETVYASDDEIEQAVEDAFLYDPRVLSFNPDVEIEGGTVTLTGEVDSLSAKKAAEEVARNTVGVWRVHNLLRVRMDRRPGDEELTDRVRDAIVRDPYVERAEISVYTLNGKVYLYGTVDSLFEKMHARDVARDIRGVADIENNLEVRNGEWTWKDDLEIKQDVEDQLFWSPFVDSDRITVDVENGTVYLNGTVDTWYERRKAAENAWEGGARNVTNNLKVLAAYDYFLWR